MVDVEVVAMGVEQVGAEKLLEEKLGFDMSFLKVTMTKSAGLIHVDG